MSERDVDAAAWNQDWSLVRTIQATENIPHEIIWQASVENIKIHYIEDFHLGLAYLVLHGENLNSVAHIRSTLPSYAEDDVFRMLAEPRDDPENLVKALHYLGLIAPSQFDPKFFALLKFALLHPDSRVRSAIVTAIGYIGWSAFKPLLESLQKSDPDPEVWQDAEVMLSGFKLYAPAPSITS